MGKLIYEGKLAKEKLDKTSEVDDILNEKYNKGLQARNKLIESNYRLVVYHSKKYSYSSLPYLDLIQEGNQGLLQAANLYDYKHGTRFSTYATYWINQAFKRAVDNLSRTVKVPIYVLDKRRKVNRFINKYYEENQCYPSEDEILTELDISLNDYNKIKHYPQILSLNKTLNSEGDVTLEQLIASNNTLDPNQQLNKDMFYKTLYERLEKLNENEQTVITYRYGLYNKPILTLKKLAAKLNLSIERVRQIELESLKKLRLDIKNKDTVM